MAVESRDCALRLRPLALADEHDARRAHEELGQEQFEFLLDLRQGEPWHRYVERMNRMALGVDLPDGWVPATFLVAEVEAEEALVGRVSIRHNLDAPYLTEFGGHIGYAVRPAYRRRGYATAILRGALLIAHELGVERVLLTCDVDNVTSAGVIERCGGALEGVVPGGEVSPPRRRYWIGG